MCCPSADLRGRSAVVEIIFSYNTYTLPKSPMQSIEDSQETAQEQVVLAVFLVFLLQFCSLLDPKVEANEILRHRQAISPRKAPITFRA